MQTFHPPLVRLCYVVFAATTAGKEGHVPLPEERLDYASRDRPSGALGDEEQEGKFEGSIHGFILAGTMTKRAVGLKFLRSSRAWPFGPAARLELYPS